MSIAFNGLSEFQFSFDTCYFLLMSTILFCYATLQKHICTFC